MQPPTCHLRPRREAAGLTLTALARQVGVSRQALTAVEAGRSTPSTAVALRLAQALDCSVEDLFTLDDAPIPGLSLPSHVGERVILGRLADRWVAHPVPRTHTGPADGVVDPSGRIVPTVSPHDAARTALVAGCAPTLGVLVGRVHRPGDGPARWLQTSSSRALQALADGRVHLAGVHLADLDDPAAHDRLVTERLGDTTATIMPLVGWQEGLAVRADSPIRSPADLVHARVALRPEGSGAARILARALAAHGLSPDDLTGPAAPTHLDATLAVVHGTADAAVVIEPVARAHGLRFLPLAAERFELVATAHTVQHPVVQRLLDHLTDARYRREVHGMGPYQTTHLGAARRVQP